MKSKHFSHMTNEKKSISLRHHKFSEFETLSDADEELLLGLRSCKHSLLSFHANRTESSFRLFTRFLLRNDASNCAMICHYILTHKIIRKYTHEYHMLHYSDKHYDVEIVIGNIYKKLFRLE